MILLLKQNYNAVMRSSRFYIGLRDLPFGARQTKRDFELAAEQIR